MFVGHGARLGQQHIPVGSLYVPLPAHSCYLSTPFFRHVPDLPPSSTDMGRIIQIHYDASSAAESDVTFAPSINVADTLTLLDPSTYATGKSSVVTAASSIDTLSESARNNPSTGFEADATSADTPTRSRGDDPSSNAVEFIDSDDFFDVPLADIAVNTGLCTLPGVIRDASSLLLVGDCDPGSSRHIPKNDLPAVLPTSETDVVTHVQITEDLGFDALHGSKTDQCSTSELKDVLHYVPIDAGTIGTLFDLDTQEMPACSDIEAHVAPHDKTKDLVLDAFSYAMAQQPLSEDKALNSGPVDSSIMLDTSIDCTTGITNLHETCKSTQLLTLVNLPLAQISQGDCSHLRKPEGEALMNFDTTNTFGIENTICLLQTSVQPLKQSSTQSTIEDNQNLKSKRKKKKRSNLKRKDQTTSDVLETSQHADVITASQETSFDHIIYVPTPCSSAFEFEPADTSRTHNNGGSDSSSAAYATSRSCDLPILDSAIHNPKLVVEAQINADIIGAFDHKPTLSCNALDKAQFAASAPDEEVMAYFEEAVDADNTEESDAAEINGIEEELYFDTTDGLVEESSNSTQENGEILEIKSKKNKNSKRKNSKTEDIISTSSDSTEKSSAAEVNGIERELYFDATENSSKITHENKNKKKKGKSKMKNYKNEDMTSTNAASAEVSQVGIRENLLSIINARPLKNLHKWVYLGTY
ncbi:hypothetical protein L7F22_049086 [Adiantum nelumboides]|nr:hypothetical protein [Adiantum nelumboides]